VWTDRGRPSTAAGHYGWAVSAACSPHQGALNALSDTPNVTEEVVAARRTIRSRSARRNEKMMPVSRGCTVVPFNFVLGYGKFAVPSG